jgi:hypothetical protein
VHESSNPSAPAASPETQEEVKPFRSFSRFVARFWLLNIQAQSCGICEEAVWNFHKQFWLSYGSMSSRISELITYMILVDLLLES